MRPLVRPDAVPSITPTRPNRKLWARKTASVYNVVYSFFFCLPPYPYFRSTWTAGTMSEQRTRWRRHKRRQNTIMKQQSKYINFISILDCSVLSIPRTRRRARLLVPKKRMEDDDRSFQLHHLLLPTRLKLAHRMLLLSYFLSENRSRIFPKRLEAFFHPKLLMQSKLD